MRTAPRAIALATFILAVGDQTGTVAQIDSEPRSSLSAAEIFGRMERANTDREQALQSYLSTRRYAVYEPGHEPDAEMIVSMQFVAPSSKAFTTVSATGIGWIHKRVFRALMDAEMEAAVGTEHRNSAISPANYDVQLAGEEQYHGRDCYVLTLEAKRRAKYLLNGKVWIDKVDFAIAKLEGEPVKSPSFWVTRAPFVREYQRVDRFWLPLRDETHTQVRFAGEYVLRIEYGDYHVGADQAVDGGGSGQ